MTGERPHVAILGGGPAGVGGAYRLRREGRAAVTLFEQRDAVGGNAGSFRIGAQWVDYGSHRLHHACDPGVLADIRRMLGDDLARRERHGRIRLRGRWLHFPLRPVDLLLRLDRRFALGAARDMARGALPGGPPEGDTFASVLEANLGPTICEHFYFPYARKLWGLEPEDLSAIQARKRVSASSFGKLLRKVLTPRGRHFYYPREGYGQISRAYAAEARRLGADLRLGRRVTRLRAPPSEREPWTVVAERDGKEETVRADRVWSTIPIPVVARILDPPPPERVLEAAASIRYRAMVLVYLELDVHRFTDTDAHYFPESAIAASRLSEPKNYSGREEPHGTTTLCAELPCDPDDEIWSASAERLGERVTEDMRRAELPLERPPASVHVRRLRQAYPIYARGYEVPFGILDEWAEALPRFLTYGRQGLFAHDNTHHALYMAYAAAECLRADGSFDEARWSAYREVFATHVVED